MKATATIIIRGRVGRHELEPGPWVEGLADKLAGSRVAIAYKRDDGTIGHAQLTGAAVSLGGNGDVKIEVEMPDADVDLPPAPHTSTLDRLDEIIGDRPLG